MPTYFSFEGEDGPPMEKLKAEQIQQQRVWLELQIREKRMAQEEEKKVEQLWEDAEKTKVACSMALASAEKEYKNKLIEDNSRYNQSLVSANDDDPVALERETDNRQFLLDIYYIGNRTKNEKKHHGCGKRKRQNCRGVQHDHWRFPHGKN